MTVISWLIFGLVVGALAKYLMPGRDPPGCILTVVLGIAGAFIGGWIGSLFGWGHAMSINFELRSVALATLGAMVVLLAGRVVLRRRGPRDKAGD
ncbi:MAG: GlsB/YeaQ/YmgE family stress response membrane protein [Gemmatimonadaceae bacterium]